MITKLKKMTYRKGSGRFYKEGASCIAGNKLMIDR